MPLTKVRLRHLIDEKVRFIHYLKTEDDITYRGCILGINNIQLELMIELYVGNFKLTKREERELETLKKECNDIKSIRGM
jgi:hypothetical protein